MLKILLVYDDFQELTAVELMLKKIGFDVVGITSEFSLAEQLLSFNPQVVVAQGRTPKVSTANVGRRLRESLRWDGQSILVFYPNAKPQAAEILKIRMDVGLEYPVEPTKMVQVLAQMGNLDSNQLLDKLIKSMTQEIPGKEGSGNSTFSGKTETESIYVGGGQGAEADQKNLIGSSSQGETTQRGVGGAAGADSSSRAVEGASGNEADRIRTMGEGLDPAASSLKNPLQNSSSQDPLFPLSPQDRGLETKGVGGSGLTGGSESNGVTGQFGLNHPFQQIGHDKIQDPLMQELENLLQKKPDLSLAPLLQDPIRHKKHDEYMKTIPIHELSSIKRRDAKLRLKDIIKDIDKHELEDQDVLRREYVKALFKKEG